MTYQLRTFARRNRVLVGAAATVLAVSVAAAVVSAVWATRASDAREAMRQERDTAQELFATLLQGFQQGGFLRGPFEHRRNALFDVSQIRPGGGGLHGQGEFIKGQFPFGFLSEGIVFPSLLFKFLKFTLFDVFVLRSQNEALLVSHTFQCLLEHHDAVGEPELAARLARCRARSDGSGCLVDVIKHFV